jgi:hypothetical protein
MKRVSDHSDHLLSRDFVESLIKKWKPLSFKSGEKEQERDLLAWLKKNLPEVPISTQYGIALGSADIVIQDSFLIELKMPFTDKKKSEFDRCIGQMEHYKQKWVDLERGPVYLVIVGESESEFRDILHQAIKRLNRGYFLKWFYLVEKLPTV